MQTHGYVYYVHMIQTERMAQTEPLELLTSSQAARLLGVARSSVLNLVNSGDLEPAARVAVTKNGSYLFYPGDVEALRDARKAKAVAK